MRQYGIKPFSFIFSGKTNLSFSVFIFRLGGHIFGTLSIETMAHPSGARKS